MRQITDLHPALLFVLGCVALAVLSKLIGPIMLLGAIALVVYAVKHPGR
jgi:hypothetical protein